MAESGDENGKERKVIPFTGKVQKDGGPGLLPKDIPPNVIVIGEEKFRKRNRLGAESGRNPAQDPQNLALVTESHQRRGKFLATAKEMGQVWDFLHRNQKIRTAIAALKEDPSKRVWIVPKGYVPKDDSEASKLLSDFFNRFDGEERKRALVQLRLWLENEFPQKAGSMPQLGETLAGHVIQWETIKSSE